MSNMKKFLNGHIMTTEIIEVPLQNFVVPAAMVLEILEGTVARYRYHVPNIIMSHRHFDKGHFAKYDFLDLLPLSLVLSVLNDTLLLTFTQLHQNPFEDVFSLGRK